VRRRADFARILAPPRRTRVRGFRGLRSSNDVRSGESTDMRAATPTAGQRALAHGLEETREKITIARRLIPVA